MYVHMGRHDIERELAIRGISAGRDRGREMAGMTAVPAREPEQRVSAPETGPSMA